MKEFSCYWIFLLKTLYMDGDVVGLHGIISATFGIIAIHSLQKMNHTDFDDLTFPLAPPQG